MITQITQNAPEWVKASDIAKMFGIAKQGIFRMAARGEFPKPIKLGRNRRWNTQEVQSWIEAQRKGDEDNV